MVLKRGFTVFFFGFWSNCFTANGLTAGILFGAVSFVFFLLGIAFVKLVCILNLALSFFLGSYNKSTVKNFPQCENKTKQINKWRRLELAINNVCEGSALDVHLHGGICSACTSLTCPLLLVWSHYVQRITCNKTSIGWVQFNWFLCQSRCFNNNILFKFKILQILLHETSK